MDASKTLSVMRMRMGASKTLSIVTRMRMGASKTLSIVTRMRMDGSKINVRKFMSTMYGINFFCLTTMMKTSCKQTMWQTSCKQTMTTRHQLRQTSYK